MPPLTIAVERLVLRSRLELGDDRPVFLLEAPDPQAQLVAGPHPKQRPPARTAPAATSVHRPSLWCRGRDRTLTGFPPMDFESIVAAVSPPRPAASYSTSECRARRWNASIRSSHQTCATLGSAAASNERRRTVPPTYGRTTNVGRSPPDVVGVDDPVTLVDLRLPVGIYLGDGCLTKAPKGVWRLRIFQDQRYVSLIRQCAGAILSSRSVEAGTVRRLGCVEIYSNWKHWLCLFPQHGPGPKHRRRFVCRTGSSARPTLCRWTRCAVLSSPTAAARSTGSADRPWTGSRNTNTSATTSPMPRRISGMFADACDLVGVEHRVMTERVISVARRSSVEILDHSSARRLGCRDPRRGTARAPWRNLAVIGSSGAQTDARLAAVSHSPSGGHPRPWRTFARRRSPTTPSSAET